MAVGVGDLRFFYSGGAANETPADSIGGVISTATNGFVKSQDASALTNLTSYMTVLDAFGNAEGVGSLLWETTANVLSWKGPTGATYNGVTITADQEEVIGDPSGYLRVDITNSTGLLALGDTSDVVTITHADAKVFDDLSAAQSLAGKTSYRCIYLKNTHGVDSAATVKIWIGQQPIGADDLAIGIENVGVSPTAIADELTAPSGITFTTPSSYDTGLTLDDDGSLDSGEFVAIWERRTIAANNNAQTIDDTSYLSVAANL